MSRSHDTFIGDKIIRCFDQEGACVAGLGNDIHTVQDVLPDGTIDIGFKTPIIIRSWVKVRTTDLLNDSTP